MDITRSSVLLNQAIIRSSHVRNSPLWIDPRYSRAKNATAMPPGPTDSDSPTAPAIAETYASGILAAEC